MSAATVSTAAVQNQLVADATELRIKAIVADNEQFERRSALYRTYREEDEALSMRVPLTAKQAYGYLGLFLGVFPPATFFYILDGYGLTRYAKWNGLLFFFFLLMNTICALVGWKMGQALGNSAQLLERSSWSKMLLCVPLVALFWAIVTGFAGGAIFFIIGGFYGMVIASMVAVPSFLAFSALHRLLERGTMIERAHVLPMAAGIALTISAFMLAG